jgi:HlyD family secretion protein
MAVEGATKEQRAAVAAKVREAQAAVDEVKSYLSDARVYAPISGRISNIISEPGELVSSGYPVVTILDLSDMWVVFNIKESDMVGIALGVRFDGYIPALDKTLQFEVNYMASEADFAMWSATRARGGFDIRTFEVHARPIGDFIALLPGMSVVVRGVI